MQPSPYLMMLYMKFDQTWGTDFKDIHVSLKIGMENG